MENGGRFGAACQGAGCTGEYFWGDNTQFTYDQFYTDNGLVDFFDNRTKREACVVYDAETKIFGNLQSVTGCEFQLDFVCEYECGSKLKMRSLTGVCFVSFSKQFSI